MTRQEAEAEAMRLAGEFDCTYRATRDTGETFKVVRVGAISEIQHGDLVAVPASGPTFLYANEKTQ